jgi:hypothetical protein
VPAAAVPCSVRDLLRAHKCTGSALGIRSFLALLSLSLASFPTTMTIKATGGGGMGSGSAAWRHAITCCPFGHMQGVPSPHGSHLR